MMKWWKPHCLATRYSLQLQCFTIAIWTRVPLSKLSASKKTTTSKQPTLSKLMKIAITLLPELKLNPGTQFPCKNNKIICWASDKLIKHFLSHFLSLSLLPFDLDLAQSSATLQLQLLHACLPNHCYHHHDGKEIQGAAACTSTMMVGQYKKGTDGGVADVLCHSSLSHFRQFLAYQRIFRVHSVRSSVVPFLSVGPLLPPPPPPRSPPAALALPEWVDLARKSGNELTLLLSPKWTVLLL